MSIINAFVHRQLFEQATKALLSGQEEYRLPRQIIRNQYATFQFVAKLQTRDGKKGVLVEAERNEYQNLNGNWCLEKSTTNFVGFYPLSFIDQLASFETIGWTE